MSKFGNLMQNFIMSSPRRANWFLSKRPEDFWIKQGRKKALATFKMVAANVGAYKKFLKEHKINPDDVKTIEDFSNLPYIDKKNYIDENSLNDLVLGKIDDSFSIASSSGSTGKSYYWPRLPQQDANMTNILNIVYSNFLEVEKHSTLCIITLALGMWMAGEAAADVSRTIAKKKGKKMVVVTPGLDYEEALRVSKDLGDHFDQILFIGYGSFLSDLLEEGKKRGIDWSKHHLKFVTGGEAVTEETKEYLLNFGKNPNKYTDFINLYAAADAAIIGFETPFSNLIKDLASKNDSLCESLFGEKIVPSLAQYNPAAYYLELVNQELVITTYSALPLVRYNIHDRGNLLSFNKAISILEKFGYKTDKLMEFDLKSNIWNLPFVYVSGKSSGATLYGITIYPEYIANALETTDLEKYAVPEFKLKTLYKDKDQFLSIEVKLKNRVTPNKELEDLFRNEITKKLRKNSTEYVKLLKSIGTKDHIELKLTKFEDYIPNVAKVSGKKKYLST